MSKPFKTIEEQLEILKNRKLKFKDEEKAKSYLLRNNYYNLINNYGKFISENDIYKENTYFEDLIAIRHFETNIRITLFRYIMESEKIFKSIFAYEYSKEFKNNPDAYLFVSNYNLNYNKKSNELIKDINLILKKQSKLDGKNPIKHYLNEYKIVPIWILCLYLTFGQMKRFFELLNKELKINITKNFSELLNENINKDVDIQFKTFQSFLFNIHDLRNKVAHNNRILNYKCRNNTIYLEELHSLYNIDRNESRNDIYNVIVILKCFLSKEQYKELHNSICNSVRKLRHDFNKYGDKSRLVYFEKILNSLGIPVDIKKII